jgi:hypothetical protein
MWAPREYGQDAERAQPYQPDQPELRRYMEDEVVRIAVAGHCLIARSSDPDHGVSEEGHPCDPEEFRAPGDGLTSRGEHFLIAGQVPWSDVTALRSRFVNNFLGYVNQQAEPCRRPFRKDTG